MSDTEQAISKLIKEINKLNLRVRRLETEREDIERNVQPREHNIPETSQPFIVGETVRINSNTGGLRGHVRVITSLTRMQAFIRLRDETIVRRYQTSISRHTPSRR
mmetsp:Transcript_11026/g.15518  ORF Transcript_11026/g.15518 Transcript_11026/m.15518 type:complete len:106 (-) Transcript_11026:603-920(-)